MSDKPLEIPKTGLAGLRAHFKDDAVSGLLISLIALPLCLGIALASGVPPIAGLFTAIIGGLLVSRINGTFVTITGPAAGLIVVTLGAVESLGGLSPLPGESYAAGYPHALGAIVVGSGVIMLFGLLRVGRISDFFPVAVIHGMLAGIGVIIMVKQFFVALGTKPESHGGGHGLIDTILQIPHGFMSLNPHIALIGLVSILIIIIHPYLNFKFIQIIPAPMWVILVAIPAGMMLDLRGIDTYAFLGQTYEAGPKFFVRLPAKIAEGIVFPSFEKIGELAFWTAVLTVALVTSIESLLSAIAVDTLDPFKRRSNLDKDLFAMGAGSVAAGCIGGLPMISEIVRSSANVTNGAKTQWSNFFHGSFLLVFLLLGKPLIDQIPLSALAAMLITVGFKLAAPREFRHVLEIGKAQLFLFVLTMVTVVATDLLIGVATGIIAKLIIHLYYGTSVFNAFKPEMTTSSSGDRALIQIKESAIFSNFLSIKGYVLKLDKEVVKNVVLDFQDVKLVDHTVMSGLKNLRELLKERGQSLILINTDHLTAVSEHPLSTRLYRTGAPVEQTD